jgi:hypothetical protein
MLFPALKMVFLVSRRVNLPQLQMQGAQAGMPAHGEVWGSVAHQVCLHELHQLALNVNVPFGLLDSPDACRLLQTGVA